jgi:hypothetical protein
MVHTPSRAAIATADGGSAWVSLTAARNRLFLLHREEAHWIVRLALIGGRRKAVSDKFHSRVIRRRSSSGRPSRAGPWLAGFRGTGGS